MASDVASASQMPVAENPRRVESRARRLRWLWLVYLIFFILGPVLYATPRAVVYTAGGIALFLPLYFWAGKLHGWSLLAPIVGMVLIGVFFVRHNPGASVFFVYAAAECAGLGTRRRTYAGLAVLALLVVVVGLTLQSHPFFMIPSLALVGLIGTVTLYDRELALANRAVRLSQEEVERVARIAERERIGRDLHDLVGHTLSLVVLKSELAAKLAESDPARALREIREVESVARQALEEVRRAVTAYRSESLPGEIENARRALAAAGVELAVEVEPVRLPPVSEAVLALALREAVTNVLRHAQATHCRVALRADGDSVRLIVEDDGVGIVGSLGGEGGDGAGLRGMRERVASLGGTVERQAGESERGTRLALFLPLPNTAPMASSPTRRPTSQKREAAPERDPRPPRRRPGDGSGRSGGSARTGQGPRRRRLGP